MLGLSSLSRVCGSCDLARTKSHSTLSVPTFWALSASYTSPADLLGVLEEASRETETLRICDQLIVLSRILRSKYLLLKVSMGSLIIAAVALLSSVILGA